MVVPQIQNLADITDAQANYLAGLAQSLSLQNDFAIQNFADSVVTSPDAQSALQNKTAMDMVQDETPQDAAFDIFYPNTGGTDALALSSFQQESIFPGLWNKVENVFSVLRRKVNRIFCDVVKNFANDKDLDLKKIIKDVLVVLVPLLAGSAGLLPVALPIVVSLGAMLIKYGAAKVCPI